MNTRSAYLHLPSGWHSTLQTASASQQSNVDAGLQVPKVSALMSRKLMHKFVCQFTIYQNTNCLEVDRRNKLINYLLDHRVRISLSSFLHGLPLDNKVRLFHRKTHHLSDNPYGTCLHIWLYRSEAGHFP